MNGAKVIPLFAAPIAERVADRVVPPVTQPTTLRGYRDASGIQLDRDRLTSQLGTWVAVGVGVAAFFVVRDWRHRSRRKESVRATS